MEPIADVMEADWRPAAGLDEALLLFEIPLPRLLAYLETATGKAPAVAEGGVADWHLALREGFAGRLHINLGMAGIEEPEHPIEENAAALYAALLLGAASISVILSGDLERAVRAGLITRRQLAEHARAWARAEAGINPQRPRRRAGATRAPCRGSAGGRRTG